MIGTTFKPTKKTASTLTTKYLQLPDPKMGPIEVQFGGGGSEYR